MSLGAQDESKRGIHEEIDPKELIEEGAATEVTRKERDANTKRFVEDKNVPTQVIGRDNDVQLAGRFSTSHGLFRSVTNF